MWVCELAKSEDTEVRERGTDLATYVQPGVTQRLAELRRKAIGVRLWNVGRPLTLMP